MNKRLTRQLPLLLSITFYLSVGCLLLPYYRYQINPDGISYINNALLILKGHFILSVNDHWNPLISWLLAPFLLMGIKAQPAFKLMNLLMGVPVFILANVWLQRLKLAGWIRWLTLFVLVPPVLWMAMSVISPDLLLAVCLLLYLTILYRPGYFDKGSNAIAPGFAAGLAYLAKYYSLPFIMVHLLAYHALEYYHRRHENGRKILKNYALSLLIFTTIAISWMVLQSQKYNQFGMGHHANGWAFAFIDPNQEEFILDRSGLVPPPYPAATSAWDDPHCVPVVPWSPWKSMQDMVAYANIIRGFFSISLDLLNQFSPFAWGIVLVFIFWGFGKFSSIPSSKEAWKWLLPFFIYIGGYLLVWVEERYLWFVNLLLVIMLLHVLAIWFKQGSTFAKKIVTVLLLVSFCYFPMEKLVNYFDRDKKYFDLARQLQAAETPGEARIASNKNWNESLYLCHYRDWKYYGSCAIYDDQNLMKKELQANRIDCFLYWGHEPTAAFSFLQNYPDLLSGSIRGMHLYDLRSMKQE